MLKGEIMTLQERIIKTEQEFPKVFAEYAQKPYGMLFYDKSNKLSHDSNHAIIYPSRIGDLSAVLADITDFYLSKGIEPRIYHPADTGYFEENRSIFEKCGYRVSIYGDYDIQTMQSENTIGICPDIEIRRITQWDARIAGDIFIPGGEPWEVDVTRKTMQDKNGCVLVAYIGKKAAAVVYFHLSEYGCTRFDYIYVAKEYRRQGIGRQIHSAAVSYCRDNGFTDIFMWYANEISHRICYESGLRPLFKMPSGEALYIKGA